jgi:integral membrane protein
MIKIFKVIALCEGVSALLLFFFAMPMKYIFENPAYIRPIGMGHGVLFTIYIIMAVMLKIEQNWDWKKFIIICLGSIVPGGTFYVDKKYL